MTYSCVSCSPTNDIWKRAWMEANIKPASTCRKHLYLIHPSRLWGWVGSVKSPWPLALDGQISEHVIPSLKTAKGLLSIATENQLRSPRGNVIWPSWSPTSALTLFPHLHYSCYLGHVTFSCFRAFALAVCSSLLPHLIQLSNQMSSPHRGLPWPPSLNCTSPPLYQSTYYLKFLSFVVCPTLF